MKHGHMYYFDHYHRHEHLMSVDGRRRETKVHSVRCFIHTNQDKCIMNMDSSIQVLLRSN